MKTPVSKPSSQLAVTPAEQQLSWWCIVPRRAARCAYVLELYFWRQANLCWCTDKRMQVRHNFPPCSRDDGGSQTAGQLLLQQLFVLMQSPRDFGTHLASLLFPKLLWPFQSLCFFRNSSPSKLGLSLHSSYPFAFLTLCLKTSCVQTCLWLGWSERRHFYVAATLSTFFLPFSFLQCLPPH